MSAELTVTLFVCAITLGIFVLPFKIKFDDYIRDFIFKRGCLVLGMFSLALNSAIVRTIAINNTMNLNRPLFTYLYLIMICCYVILIYYVISTIFLAKKLFRERKIQERME